MSSRTKFIVLVGYGFGIALLIFFSPKVNAVQDPDGPLLAPQHNPVFKPIVAPAQPSLEAVNRIATQHRALDLERLRPILVNEPGPAYRRAVVKNNSHYFDPIKDGDGLSGRSRRWGDADYTVQAQCIVRLTKKLRSAGFTESEVSFAVALCRCESGFNPDAAAGYSSASGLGQFLDRTRGALCKRANLRSSDPFDADLNVICMSETLKECFAFARKYAKPGTIRYFQFAYAYHHDGPALNSGGLEIAAEKVLPWLETVKKCISQ